VPIKTLGRIVFSAFMRGTCDCSWKGFKLYLHPFVLVFLKRLQSFLNSLCISVKKFQKVEFYL